MIEKGKNKMKSLAKRTPAYRDGVEHWTEGEFFTAPGGETVEVLYKDSDARKKDKVFFVELPGIPTCAHGSTVEEAIDEARAKREEGKPLTDEEKERYKVENYKFSVSLFRRITRACNSGIDAWLGQRGLDRTVTMTLPEFREAGGGEWAEALARKLQ